MSISEFVVKNGTIRRGMKDAGTSGGPIWLIQKALNNNGAALTADGDYGRATEAAVIRYKAAHGYAATGDVGPLTAKFLDDDLAKPAVPVHLQDTVAPGAPPWLVVNRAITGVKEFVGSGDNPIIMNWCTAISERFPELAKYTKSYTHDSIPWCGLEQAYTFAKAGFKPPKEFLYATNWANSWADGVRLPGPALGAVLVKTRAGGGHVTQYEGEDDNNYFCRGGNQTDMVNVSKISKAGLNIVGWMWPKGHPLPTGGRIRTSFNSAVSGKEA